MYTTYQEGSFGENIQVTKLLGTTSTKVQNLKIDNVYEPKKLLRTTYEVRLPC